MLLLLLPPLLCFSGVGMSWRSFCANAWPILLLAIGCVLFTAAAVAAVAHFLLGIPWSVGFVLGAIVSPPDAVAPTALLRYVRLPRRLVAILEGESPVNEATALVAFSFALGAVATGTFAPVDAAMEFVAIVVGELAYGVLIGWTILHIRHYARDLRVEILLALMTSFVAFWPKPGARASPSVSPLVSMFLTCQSQPRSGPTDLWHRQLPAASLSLRSPGECFRVCFRFILPCIANAA